MTADVRPGVVAQPPPSGPGRPSRARRIRSALDARGPRHRSTADRGPIGWIYLVIISITFFQRFVFPDTLLFIALPITLFAALMLAVSGHLVADAQRTLWYLAAVGACGTATLIATSWQGVPLSLSSLGLLAVIYLPCCGRLSPVMRNRMPEVLEFFQGVMLVLGAVCVGQWAAQFAGWTWEDLLSFLPPDLLADGEKYNLSDPIYYGATISKSNGIVFLEPSFCSQFLALAVIIQLLLGRKRWRLAVLLPALLSTVSGTGLILLAVGLVVLLVRRGGRWASRAIVAIVLVSAAVAATPVGELLADRSNEPAVAGSSGHVRFVAPYERLVVALPSHLPALLVGRGAGSIDRDVEFFNPEHVESNYPALPKLLGEYGLPAALVFTTFLMMLFVHRRPSVTLGAMALVLYFVLSSSLLQAPTVYLAWLLTGLFAAGGPTGNRPLPYAETSQPARVWPAPPRPARDGGKEEN